jgi:hypothetical protein
VERRILIVAMVGWVDVSAGGVQSELTKQNIADGSVLRYRVLVLVYHWGSGFGNPLIDGQLVDR